jgi:hypothetical protein
LIPRLRQVKYKLSLGHLVVLEKRKKGREEKREGGRQEQDTGHTEA